MDLTAGVATYQVPSATVPNRLYAVRLHRDGRWSCNCVGYTYFRPPRRNPDLPRTCRHIKAVTEEACLDQLRRWHAMRGAAHGQT